MYKLVEELYVAMHGSTTRHKSTTLHTLAEILKYEITPAYTGTHVFGAMSISTVTLASTAMLIYREILEFTAVQKSMIMGDEGMLAEVYENGKVFGYAHVGKNARIHGNAHINGDKHYYGEYE